MGLEEMRGNRIEYPLPDFYIHLLREGRATLFVNGDGAWYCYTSQDGVEDCYKLFKKINLSPITIRMLAILSRKMCSVRDLADELGLEYRYVYNLLYYYYKANLVKREFHLYSLNLRHPQAQLFLERINKLLFSDDKDSLRLPEIAQDKPLRILSNKKTGSDKSEAKLDLDKILAKARIFVKGLSPLEIEIIMKLVEWRETRGRWYVCAENPEELADLLNINSSGSEVSEALKRLERAGVVFRFFDKRHRQHCFRISKKVLA